MLDVLSRGLHVPGNRFCIRDSIVWICALMQCGQILASSLLSMEAIVTATAISSGMSSIERDESCGMERISPSLRATPVHAALILTLIMEHV